MKFENSEYAKLKYSKIERPFGVFYLLDTFFISELNEGIHFEWEMIKDVMHDVVNYYGKYAKLGYVSNRVNSYSINPNHWNKVDKEYNIIVASAIVIYNDMTLMNATLEKRFFNKSLKRCNKLSEAIEWMYGLEELKSSKTY